MNTTVPDKQKWINMLIAPTMLLFGLSIPLSIDGGIIGNFILPKLGQTGLNLFALSFIFASVPMLFCRNHRQFRFLSGPIFIYLCFTIWYGIENSSWVATGYYITMWGTINHFVYRIHKQPQNTLLVLPTHRIMGLLLIIMAVTIALTETRAGLLGIYTQTPFDQTTYPLFFAISGIALLWQKNSSFLTANLLTMPLYFHSLIVVESIMKPYFDQTAPFSYNSLAPIFLISSTVLIVAFIYSWEFDDTWAMNQS